MNIGRNIIISVLLHGTVITGALAFTGRAPLPLVPVKYVSVILSEKPAEAEGTNQKDSRRHRIRPIFRLSDDTGAPPALALPQEDKKAAAPSGPGNLGPLKREMRGDSAVFDNSPGGGYDSLTTLLDTGGAGPPAGGVHAALPGGALLNKETVYTVSRTEGGRNAAMGVIRAAIEKALIYPHLAKKRGIEGTVTAEFMIGKQGHPKDVRIVRSSGFDILDSAAKNIIVRASPFPVIDGYIEIPITFKLKKGG